MTPAILQMLSGYKCGTAQEFENALKEILQEVALLGLWRSKFFEHAAFYGGSALRILYGLDRFSEDLDFSLLQPDPGFRLTPYLKAVEMELLGLGFEVSVQEKVKTTQTAIESAFIKAGTKLHLIKIKVPEVLSQRLHKDRQMTVKLEVDTDPPAGFEVEARTLLQPIPFAVKSYQLPDLFAGKLHALLQRSWKTRVKGRDYYDFIWYVARGTPCRLGHLEQRLRQSGGLTSPEPLTSHQLGEFLRVKFSQLDVEAAKRDIEPFLKDHAALTLWSRDFFVGLLDRLKVI